MLTIRQASLPPLAHTLPERFFEVEELGEAHGTFFARVDACRRMTLDDSLEYAAKTSAHGVRQVGSVMTELLVLVNTPTGVRSFTVSEEPAKLTEGNNVRDF